MDTVHRKRVKLWEVEGHAHFYTFSCFRRQRFLNSERTCLFLVDAINKARNTYGFHLWGYVFMPEHVHLLLWNPDSTVSLSTIAKAIKQPVATRALHFLKTENPAGLEKLATGQSKTRYRFWQQGPGFDRNLSCGVHQRLDYIHANPVRRGLVQYAQDWYWSSFAAWELGINCPLIVDKEFFPALE